MNCLDCDKQLSKVNKTGRCIACGNRFRANDPEFQAKWRVAHQRKMADPLHKAKMALVARRMGEAYRRNPEGAAKLREHGKMLQRKYLSRPDIVARANCPEAKARAQAKRRARAIAWCPEEYREQYFFLLRQKRLPKAVATQITLDQIAADRARLESRLSPFERQERALLNGGRLVANDQKPSLANPGFYEERKAG